MSDSYLPRELRDSLRKTGQFVARAILISAHKVEGTAVFDQRAENSGVCGDFFPTHTPVLVAENESCQLHLEKSNIVLNVRVSPGRSEKNVPFRFELVAWEPLEQPRLVEPPKLNATWRPAPPRRHER